MKFIEKIKKIDYRHYICILITLGFLACSVFLFPTAFGRITEGLRDLGFSVVYYFVELLELPFEVAPTVNDISEVLPMPVFLPNDFEEFKSVWFRYWETWATAENFFKYLNELVWVLFLISQFLIIALPFGLLLYFVFNNYLKTQNNDYDKDSLPLKIFKTITKYTYVPVRNWVLAFISFIKEHPKYYKAWLCIWAFNFNLFTIFIEFIAFYLYFIISFDVLHIYRQVYKLFVDLSVMIDFIPLWGWAIIGLVVFHLVRVNIAYGVLNHYERRNRGFINERPIVTMVCGTMGKGKTTLITDMVLSEEVILRDKAFEKILENDLKFPYFPWINLENELKGAMERHEVYNLATVREFVQIRLDSWVDSPSPTTLFNYDYERFGFTYNDELREVTLWEVIEVYAQLYFIYVIESSLLVSNYAIRTDNVLQDVGNFPMWDSEFFKRDSRLMESYSRHSKILDFDVLRLGRKVIENNENSNSFEFGVIVITEVGKERQNAKELRERGVKTGAEEANQQNDLFNIALKMIRHPATVDNFPFVKVITDEQRPESLGADARDLCELVHIREKSDMYLSMPFFALEDLLYDWLFGKFADLYYRYRYIRSDNTLPMYLLKSFTSKINRYYRGIYNRFGFSVVKMQVEQGTQDGNYKDRKYYLMNKKIYSQRFSTDCYRGFFEDKAKQAKVGLADYPEYSKDTASTNELKQQNSYFIGDLTKLDK